MSRSERIRSGGAGFGGMGGHGGGRRGTESAPGTLATARTTDGARNALAGRTRATARITGGCARPAAE